jgi:uncharacterized damage-inducible protein DinB
MLLEALFDSWDRNNTILINLLRVIPEGGFDCRVMADSSSVGEMFHHIHYVRLVFVEEPREEWVVERDVGRMATMLQESAKVVRDAVRSRLDSGRPMNLHYDHPILFMQHMIWHEGYHHGQIKLALKMGGRALSDDVAGPVTWDVWMDKA